MRTGSKHDIKDERIDGGKAFDWSGAGETMHPIEIPACYKEKFELVHHEESSFTPLPLCTFCSP